MESGPILGAAYLLFRVAILLFVLKTALDAYQKGLTLPLLLIGVSGVDILNGQFGQPTALGFTVFNAGLALAACVPTKCGAAPAPALKTAAIAAIRGRSIYAERLHGAGRKEEV
jgi:hypothetical protein